MKKQKGNSVELFLGIIAISVSIFTTGILAGSVGERNGLIRECASKGHASLRGVEIKCEVIKKED